jgi:hypothetical protein
VYAGDGGRKRGDMCGRVLGCETHDIARVVCQKKGRRRRQTIVQSAAATTVSLVSTSAALRYDDGTWSCPTSSFPPRRPHDSLPPTPRTMSSTAQYKDRQFLAVIGDEVRTPSSTTPSLMLIDPQDTITGMLLAGVGVRSHTTPHHTSPKQSNRRHSTSRSHRTAKRTFSSSTPRPRPRPSKRHSTTSPRSARISPSC